MSVLDNDLLSACDNVVVEKLVENYLCRRFNGYHKTITCKGFYKNADINKDKCYIFINKGHFSEQALTFFIVPEYAIRFGADSKLSKNYMIFKRNDDEPADFVSKYPSRWISYYDLRYKTMRTVPVTLEYIMDIS